MTRARDISNLIDATGDIVVGALGNVPASLDGGVTINGPTTIAGTDSTFSVPSALTSLSYTKFIQTSENYVENATTSGEILSNNTASVLWLTADQTANRTFNNRYIDVFPSAGEGDVVSTQAVLFTNGATAYVINDVISEFVGISATVTVKWQGGAAPTAGNANSVDLYTFTFFRTAEDVYTCFASQPVKYA